MSRGALDRACPLFDWRLALHLYSDLEIRVGCMRVRCIRVLGWRLVVIVREQ